MPHIEWPSIFIFYINETLDTGCSHLRGRHWKHKQVGQTPEVVTVAPFPQQRNTMPHILNTELSLRK